MVRPITMPKLGQSEEVGTLVRWRKNVGDAIARGDILLEIETDKSVLEVESFFKGTLLKIVVQEGTTVPINTTLGFVGDPGEAVPEILAPAPEPPGAVEGLRQVGTPAPQPAAAAVPEVFRISPRAARLARESAIDPESIAGTGPFGRVVERDVKNYLEAGGLAEKPRPMSRMRQMIASRLTASFATTPHFFVTVAVDVTELSKFRTELRARGTPYSVTDFILKAVALSLVEFPAVNSTTDGRNVQWHSRVHLGLAVNLEQGLVVPVIRNADELSLAALHDCAAELVAKARAGKLTREEMSGSTFTISNMGMLNIEHFTAIINPGESAILAVSSTLKQPVVRNDQVVIRDIMKMTLSSDHRIIDGAVAANFTNAIGNRLEEISLWKGLA